MNEQLAKIMEMMRAAWRFRWYGLAAAWVVAVTSTIALLLIPNVYEVRARVYVDTESVLKPLLVGIAIQRDTDSQVKLMSSVLRSRPTLEGVARKTGLNARAKTSAAHERLLNDLSAAIKLDSGGATNTFTITYRDRDRVIAQKVVQTLLEVFTEQTTDMRQSDSDVATKFLREQIAEYEKRLADAEDKLADFKKKNVGLMPGQAGDYFARVQGLMSSVEALQSKYRQLESRRNELNRQLSGENPTYGANAQATANAAQLAAASAKLQELLTKYTDKHPEVIALREQIAALESQSAQLDSKPGGGAAVLNTTTPDGRNVSVLNVNPIYQNIRLSLTQTEAEMAEVRGQLEDQQKQVAELKSKINVIPDVEAQLAQLNRDYEVNRTTHTQLLQRLESARISSEAGQNADPNKFQVIEPPVVPLVAVSPKRPLLLVVAFLMSMVAGAGVAVGLHQLRPAFYSLGSLQAVVGARVLGIIGDVDFTGPTVWYRRSTGRFLAAASILVVFFGASALAMRFVRPILMAALGMSG